MNRREVVVMLWDGARKVHDLPAVDWIASAPHEEVASALRKLRVPVAPDATTVELREALLAFPTAEDREGIAAAHLPESGGVLPTVRVLERFRMPNGTGTLGPAGSIPAARVWG